MLSKLNLSIPHLPMVTRSKKCMRETPCVAKLAAKDGLRPI